MTPHRTALKREVGVRELHDQLSRYVRHAAEGGEVFVTMRGQRVARLSPLESGDPLADLRARGLLREPARPKRPAGERRRLSAEASVSDLVAEQRR
ncbi:type II toxin-antitoxin system prevent-host-death family antitoxin [Conexibacter stalactiti]|uniref:Type II toxin-antitoxin system prevent-host-death family antitoxin n=1 Tax=Conexibacter stalactiti TaxID=1940611 RepID=A0ABU4I1U1_9ACTN|nr:type II toxin-antitoxin system prevent-host-death family antitoxin [Conexibacter stalactiti]MDW5598264.1 type II toxin-antitoxin system prevent-host-death family antitoxin [Conexibacter stalactiti]MEC5038906.1 type II toxin-antitoxin system prevent-host-death family antitoxin [Conexibacter stalactiti]